MKTHAKPLLVVPLPALPQKEQEIVFNNLKKKGIFEYPALAGEDTLSRERQGDGKPTRCPLTAVNFCGSIFAMFIRHNRDHRFQ
jgi:hypothetical protein